MSRQEKGGNRGELTQLRGQLDTLDREVLKLLARRMEIVGEIAAHKREERIAVRDLDREREILKDRCAEAEKLGLPQDGVESLWRMLMLMSRDRQAALRVEVPQDAKSQTIALIGGKGGMGRLLERMFGDLGHEVWVVDVDTVLKVQDAAAKADVVVISVPIADTAKVIAQVGPLMRKDALLMDITSIKSTPVQQMLAATQASVLGTHPMFGPGIHSFQQQRIVLCPGRGEKWHAWAKQMFQARGLVVTEASAEEHDRAMAAVQVLQHMKTQIWGRALSKMGMSIEDTLRFTSPAYLLEAYVAARHFAQAPELYGPIEMLNPRLHDVTKVFREATNEVTQILESGDQDAFENLFADVGEFFGAFTQEALEQSGYLIDRLLELAAGHADR